MNDLIKYLAETSRAKVFLSADDSRPLMLVGPDGSGKKELLFYYASRALCDNLSACGECQSCFMIAAGSHPDLIVLPGSEKILIEEFRDVINQLSTSSFYGKGRFLILDDVERLNEASQQAFLKTLEEPAGRVTFLLSTSYPDYVLPTIISRSLIFHLNISDIDATAEIISKGYKVTDTDAHTISLLSGGRPALAMSTASYGSDWLDKVLSDFDSISTCGEFERFEMVDRWIASDAKLILTLFINIAQIQLKHKALSHDLQSLPTRLKVLMQNDYSNALQSVLKLYPSMRVGSPKLILSSMMMGV